MALKGNWVDKVDGVDINSADDINQVANAVIELEESGGKIGENGATFIPNVSAEGVISWTNDKDLPNPEPVNIKGTKGDKGDKGDRGLQGVQGIQGERGEQGIQGIKGDKGEKGDKGDSGKDGTNGVNGKDGYTPVKGVDYFDGVNGKDGKDGADGYTPVRGTDYWTSADKAEIKSYVDDAIIGGAW